MPAHRTQKQTKKPPLVADLLLAWYDIHQRDLPWRAKEVQALAIADQQEVLRAWAGLGYYSRARNLHACAKEIVSAYQGQFPDSYALLKALPGIGDYTASAILAIAFAKHAIVIDGNVERVVSRLARIQTAVPIRPYTRCRTVSAQSRQDRTTPPLRTGFRGVAWGWRFTVTQPA